MNYNKCTLLKLLTVTIFLVASACSSSDKDGPQLINTVNPALKLQADELESELSDVNIKYDSGRQSFFNTRDLYLACTGDLNNTLMVYGEEFLKIKNSLVANSHLYRGAALDFYRKMDFMATKLGGYAFLNEAFCQDDFPKIEKCLQESSFKENSVYIQLGSRTSGQTHIHPFIKLTNTSYFAGFEEKLNSRIYNKRGDYVDRVNSTQKIIDNSLISRSSINNTVDCLNHNTYETESARTLVNGFESLKYQASDYCLAQNKPACSQ